RGCQGRSRPLGIRAARSRPGEIRLQGAGSSSGSGTTMVPSLGCRNVRPRGTNLRTPGAVGAGLLGWVTLPGSWAGAGVVGTGGGSGGGGGGGGGGLAVVVAGGGTATPDDASICERTTVHVMPTAKRSSPATMNRTMRRRLEPSSSGGGSVSSG